MLLLRPKRWSEHPPAGGVQVRRDLPAGVIGVWLFNEAGLIRNLATEHFGAISGTAQGPTVTARGYARSHGHSDNRANLLESAYIGLLPTSAITIALGHNKASAANTAAFGVGNNVAGELCGSFIAWGDGKIYWDFGGGTEDATRESVSPSVAATGYHAFAFTVGPRGMEIFMDGRRESANSATPTRTASSAIPYQLGFHSNVGSDTNARYHWFFMHRTQLPGDLIREISLFPFGVLLEPQAPRRSLFIPPAPAGGGGGTVRFRRTRSLFGARIGSRQAA